MRSKLRAILWITLVGAVPLSEPAFAVNTGAHPSCVQHATADLARTTLALPSVYVGKANFSSWSLLSTWASEMPNDVAKDLGFTSLKKKDELGSGGMGRVDLVEATTPNGPKLYALKTVTEFPDKTALSNVMALEAAGADIQHTAYQAARQAKGKDAPLHIIPMLKRIEYEAPGGGRRVGYLMEVGGVTLRTVKKDPTYKLVADRINPRRMIRDPNEIRRSLLNIASVAANFSEVLGELGLSNTVHQDFKPVNFVLVGEGPNRRLAILDFGISRKVGDVTDDGVGTPVYMPPESLHKASPWNDAYASALMIAEMLTGMQPESKGQLTPEHLKPDLDAQEALYATFLTAEEMAVYRQLRQLVERGLQGTAVERAKQLTEAPHPWLKVAEDGRIEGTSPEFLKTLKAAHDTPVSAHRPMPQPLAPISPLRRPTPPKTQNDPNAPTQGAQTQLPKTQTQLPKTQTQHPPRSRRNDPDAPTQAAPPTRR